METAIFYFLNIILGLVLGSFIGMLSFRLPKHLEHTWKNECLEFLDLPIEPKKSRLFDLFSPRSCCPHCLTKISCLCNIPLLSFLFLKGKCANCQKPISKRYPIIELITTVAFFSTALYFDLSYEWLFALVLTFFLILLVVIDAEHHILPDQITIPLLWTGLILNTYELFSTLTDAVIGAVCGYLFLWIFAKSYQKLTGKYAMGHGDFKLLACAGAWLGWQHLPFIVISSSLIGAIIGLTLIFMKKNEFSTPLPFGPYLGLAIWVSLLFGDNIIISYINLLNINYYV